MLILSVCSRCIVIPLPCGSVLSRVVCTTLGSVVLSVHSFVLPFTSWIHCCYLHLLLTSTWCFVNMFHCRGRSRFILATVGSFLLYALYVNPFARTVASHLAMQLLERSDDVEDDLSSTTNEADDDGDDGENGDEGDHDDDDSDDDNPNNHSDQDNSESDDDHAGKDAGLPHEDPEVSTISRQEHATEGAPSSPFSPSPSGVPMHDHGTDITQ